MSKKKIPVSALCKKVEYAVDGFLPGKKYNLIHRKGTVFKNGILNLNTFGNRYCLLGEDINGVSCLIQLDQIERKGWEVVL